MYRAKPEPKALALWPEERGTKRKGNMLSRWLTSPPEAGFSGYFEHRKQADLLQWSR